MTKFLQKKGVSQTKINEAYKEYYSRNDLYEIHFHERPLGFGINKDENGRNAIVTSIQKPDFLIKNGLKIGSVIYEINGKRVDGRKHDKIINVLQTQQVPFYIIFKNDENIKPYHSIGSASSKLHEHSILTSMTHTNDIDDVVEEERTIDWEQIGQILLDHRFLPSARLINQALDHLETFCHDEDLYENNLRDELSKAWSVEDDKGMILWQILYNNLHYSEKERKWFYDLILKNYFKLADMKTVNISFLMTKILRDLNAKHVNLVRMKEILLDSKNTIDGFSFDSNVPDSKRLS